MSNTISVSSGIPGPRGLPGGGVGTLPVVVDSLLAGSAAIVKNGSTQTAITSALAQVQTHAGICSVGAGVGQTATIVTQGPFPTSVKTLGNGPSCAVGTDASGNPVRVTDSSCVSGLKYLGVCDANGAIYVNPRTATWFDVTDFGAIADNATDCLSAFNKAITAASVVAGTVFVPAGDYYLSNTIQAFGFGVRLEGVGTGANSGGGNGSALHFHQASGSGLWPWREINANSLASLTLHNLRIVNENVSNTTGAAVEIMGGGGFLVSRCYFAGWKYSVILDGAETAVVTQNCFEGADTYGVWTTSGNQRGNGWTVTQATNVIAIRDNIFNGPAVQWHSDGGVTQHFYGNECNLSTGFSVEVTGGNQVSIARNYWEGSMLGGSLAGILHLDSCTNVSIAENHGAVTLTGAGVPFIHFTHAGGTLTEGVYLGANDIACGTTSGMITGTQYSYAWAFGPNVLLNSVAPGVIFDGDAGGGSVGAYPNLTGFNTVIPTASLDVLTASGSGVAFLARGPYAKYFEVVATGNAGNDSAHQHIRTLRNTATGLSGSGSVDGLAFLNTAAGSSTLSMGDTWAIPPTTWLEAEVYVVAQGAPDNTKGAAWKYSLTIHRETGAPTLVDATKVYSHSTDTFTDPTFTFDGTTRALTINVTEQTGYVCQWVARVVLTIVSTS